MAQNWNTNVNTNFYGQDSSYLDNTTALEFESGRKIYHLKNSTPTKTHSLLFQTDDSVNVAGTNKTEFQWFLFWYENTILSGTNTFYLTDIVSHSGTKEYRMTEPPQWSGQSIKEITMTIEEA